MKQFLKSMFCIGLLLISPVFTFAAPSGCCPTDRLNNCSSNSCDTGCSNSCDSSSNSCDTGCSSGCGNSSNGCNNNCDNGCSSSCGNSCSSDDCASCSTASVRTYFHIRSQGANTARELVGWQWDLNIPFMCCNYGAAYLAYEYQRSFDSCHISNALFGGKKLRFSGSLVPNRSNNDLLADNFGLSRTFQGTVSFNPVIQNHIIDLGYYLGLDAWLQGAYVRLHFPITYSHWTLNACETVIEAGTTTENACYYGSDDVNSSTTAVPYSSVPETTVATSLRNALSGTFLFGDMQTPWCAGRFDFCGRGKWALADIDLILGYNFINTDCYHFGAYLQMVLNTPPKPKDFYVFSPVVGNGGHFELGAGISSHWSIWSGEDQNLSVFLEGNITHMFNNEQCRLFDFCDNGPFSRYMLLKEYDTNGLVYNYNGSLISATCLANQKVNVKVDIKGDLSVKLAYRVCNWGFDVGYNIYGHSHETVQTKCYDESCGPSRILSPKGTSSVCCSNYPIICVPNGNEGYTPTIFPNGANIPQGSKICDTSSTPICTETGADYPEGSTYQVTTVLNNSSQPLATAYSGRPLTMSASGSAISSCSVALSPDNQQAIPDAGQPVTTLASLVSDNYLLCDSTPMAVPLTKNDLNRKSGEALSQMTNKIFGFVSYTCFDSCGWNPQLGVGAEVEWNHRKNSEVCRKTDLQQWGVWFKSSITY